MSYDDDWRAQANCRSMAPEAMQPDAATAEDVEQAKQVCIGCPVRRQCRDLAESQAGSDGISAYGVHDGEWWGDPPRLDAAGCGWCGEPLPVVEGAGRPRRYCGAECKTLARRARDAAAAA